MNFASGHTRRPYGASSGGVGVRVLWIIVSVIVIALAIVFLLNTVQKDQQRDSRKATEISEYGLQCVLETLGKKPSWTEGFSKIPYEDGWFSATLKRRVKTDTLFCAVEVTGHMGNASRKSECLLKLSFVNKDSAWTRSANR
jgi:hypothetical protein